MTTNEPNLEAIEAAYAGSTQGTWIARDADPAAPGGYGYIEVQDGGVPNGRLYGGITMGNARFVAMAHETVPTMIAELRAARKAIAAARAYSDAIDETGRAFGEALSAYDATVTR